MLGQETLNTESPRLPQIRSGVLQPSQQELSTDKEYQTYEERRVCTMAADRGTTQRRIHLDMV